MALLLYIDTALEKASVGLARDTELLIQLENDQQKDHASFVQPAIQKILQEFHLSPKDLDGVGVTAGPGSYTGLRVGMASAKGLCYALNIPMITVGTLELMAAAAIVQFPGFDAYCPMIDARRNEVFTAIFGPKKEVILTPGALILDENSFSAKIKDFRILFFGNGSGKWKTMMGNNPGPSFGELEYNGKHLAKEVYERYSLKLFADLAYTEPLYVKEFHFATDKTKK
jgi:tRNA threonylcarbamoyladenosine biosynthesis protein TsaB